MPPEAGVSTRPDGLLPWTWAVERLAAAMGTTRPDDRPHAKPVWGIWLDDALYLETCLVSRTGSNLATNPALVVHKDIVRDCNALSLLSRSQLGPIRLPA
jgi:hypothetical protein